MNIKFNKEKVKSFFFIVQAVTIMVLQGFSIYDNFKKIKKEENKK